MKRYLICLFLSTLGCGIGSLGGGAPGIVRGALLGWALAAALPLVNRQPLRSGLIGMGFGLFAGLVVVATNRNPWLQAARSVLAESEPYVIIAVCAACGFVFHFIYALRNKLHYDGMTVFQCIFPALGLLGAIRFFPVAENYWDPLLMLGASIFTMFFFSAPVCLAIFYCDPKFKPTDANEALPPTSRVIHILSRLAFDALLLFAGFIGMIGTSAYYPILKFSHSRHHTELLAMLQANLFYNDNIIGPNAGLAPLETLPQSASFSRQLSTPLALKFFHSAVSSEFFAENTAGLTIRRRADRQILWSIDETPTDCFFSPNGDLLALVFDVNRYLYKIEIRTVSDGKLIFGSEQPIFHRQCAWSKDGRYLFTSVRNGKLYRIDASKREMQAVTDGYLPSVLADGRVIFWNADQVFAADPDFKQIAPICNLPLRMSEWTQHFAILLASPDGGFLFYAHRPPSPLVEKGFLVLKEAVPDGRECIIGDFSVVAGCFYRWTSPQEINLLRQLNQQLPEVKHVKKN